MRGTAAAVGEERGFQKTMWVSAAKRVYLSRMIHPKKVILCGSPHPPSFGWSPFPAGEGKRPTNPNLQSKHSLQNPPPQLPPGDPLHRFGSGDGHHSEGFSLAGVGDGAHRLACAEGGGEGIREDNAMLHGRDTRLGEDSGEAGVGEPLHPMQAMQA